MKRTVLLLFVLPLFALTGHTQGQINWMTWEQAVEANAKEPRLIFVDTYTNWCGWCKRMDQTTFSNKFIADYVNARYYAVKLNAEMRDTIVFSGHQFVNNTPQGQRGAHELAASLLDNRLSYPSFVVLNANFERLQIIPGYQDPANFEKIIRYFSEGATRGLTQEQYMQTFKSMLN